MRSAIGIDTIAQQCSIASAMEEYVTSAEAAKKLNVSGARIRAMIADGVLEGRKEGRDWMVSTASIAMRRESHGQLSAKVRLAVFFRDKATCQECELVDESLQELHVHHVLPRAQGGTNEIENLKTLCCDCHRDLHFSRQVSTDGAPKKVCGFRFSEDVIEYIHFQAKVNNWSRTEVVEEALRRHRDHVTPPPENGAGETLARGSLNNAPKGIPTISRARKDTGEQVVIAAGHEQVERYMKAGSDEEYLAGEEVAQVVIDEAPAGKIQRNCFHEGENCLGKFWTDNPESVTCVPCALDGHAAAGLCRKCPGSDEEVVYAAGAIKPLGLVEVVEGEFGCRCVHCGAGFRSRKGARLCRKCAGGGHVDVEAKDCLKCQAGSVA